MTKTRNINLGCKQLTVRNEISQMNLKRMN